MSQWNFNFLTPKYLEMPWYQEETWVQRVNRGIVEEIVGRNNIERTLEDHSQLKAIPFGQSKLERTIVCLLSSGKPFVFQKARQFGMNNIVSTYLNQWKKSKTKA